MKKAIPILLTLSLLLNAVLAYALVHQRSQEERLHKIAAIDEITAAVQCLERYGETRNASDYMEAVISLSVACDEVESLRDVDYRVTTEPFQNMQTLAVAWPDLVKANLPQTITALSQLNTEDALTDTDVMAAFKAFTETVHTEATEAVTNEDHP